MEMYTVGTQGAIAHFDGTKWTRIESGTTVDLLDVWEADAGNVWVSGYDLATGQSSVLLHGSHSGFDVRYRYIPPYREGLRDTMSGIITSVWSGDNPEVWATDGARIWLLPSNTYGNGVILWDPTESIGFLTRLRGEAVNDVFVVGHFGEFGHFNGLSWHWFSELRAPSGLILQGLAVTDNRVVAVGLSASGAITIIGSRK
jgi:hypothetical protein